MNERIHGFSMDKVPEKKEKSKNEGGDPSNNGEVIYDATACPQDIAYPTDLGLLNKAREISEAIIDELHEQQPELKKPRTYRKVARKAYLKVAQNKNPSRKTIRKGIKSQRQYWVIQTVYDQQLLMFNNRTHQVDDRIVSIHQPHVRPIVRGKSKSKTEFGAKIHLSLVDGYSFLDTVSWDAFNEGSCLMEYVENYKERFGFYPAKVLADQLYCSRDNRRNLKEKGIKLAAKPLGRPSAKAVGKHVSPGERNPIEGKFGQAKNGYGMNRIRARLKDTSQSWIASIILVLNLVKLAGEASLCLSFSATKHIKDTLMGAFKHILVSLKTQTLFRCNPEQGLIIVHL